jgi:hypothetical protein
MGENSSPRTFDLVFSRGLPRSSLAEYNTKMRGKNAIEPSREMSGEVTKAYLVLHMWGIGGRRRKGGNGCGGDDYGRTCPLEL